MIEEPNQDIEYTIDFEGKLKKDKKSVKKLLYAILFICIVCAAACALIFGVHLAKVAI